MKCWKRVLAAMLSLCLPVTCASCGEDTAIAMTIDGVDVRAGIYLYYVVNAYGDAIQILQEGGETFTDCETTKDVKKIMKNANIDNIPAEEWIQNKAEEYCLTYVAIEKEFDRLELTLSGEDLAGVESNLASTYTYFGDFFNDNGIGEESVEDILISSVKQNAIWEAYYGEDGSEGVQDSELYDYFVDNHLRIKYIEMPLKDGEGNLLKADGKEEIEDMANDFLDRLEKKSDTEAEMLEEFDYLIEENANYVTSLSNAAVTTTDENGSTVTTATTAKVTTDEDGNSNATTGADETTETTTTATETTTTTTETTTTTTVEGETTTTTAETTTTTAATTTTTTTIDVSNEKVLLVSTSTEENADDETEETTTTEPTYTPCEKVYNWAVDPDTPLNEPELIKDDECYYVAVKLDLEKRMTEDDLWNDNNVEAVRKEIYYDTFLDKIDEWAKAYTSERNEKAFKRYKVLDVDVVEYQAAVMSSYYSQMGMSY